MSDVFVAGECLQAFGRGDDSDQAEAGAILVADFLARVRRVI